MNTRVDALRLLECGDGVSSRVREPHREDGQAGQPWSATTESGQRRDLRACAPRSYDFQTTPLSLTLHVFPSLAGARVPQKPTSAAAGRSERPLELVDEL